MSAITPLARLADRASADPHFLGHVLARVQAELAISDRLLALTLDLNPGRLPYLRLCGMPRPARWAEDIDAIARYAGCSAARLADLLQQAGSQDPGSIAGAATEGVTPKIVTAY